VNILPSMLTPFIRSDALGAILAEVFLHPDDEMTLAEISRRARVLPAVVHKEVSRLVEGGVLLDRRQGNNRLIHVNPAHPLYSPMEQIIMTSYGPVPVLRELLSPISTIDQAYIYGSWAARVKGQPGGFPRDIDVLVVGMLSVDNLVEVETQARDTLGMEVNIHRATPQAWKDPDGNQFLATVKTRPMITLLDRKEGVDARPH